MKSLALTHDDPDHDDEFLLRIEKLCQERFPNTVLAREGMEIQIGAQPEAAAPSKTNSETHRLPLDQFPRRSARRGAGLARCALDA